MRRGAWTLIELLVLLAIILIMTAILWPVVKDLLQKHRKNTKISCVRCQPAYLLPRDC